MPGYSNISVPATDADGDMDTSNMSTQSEVKQPSCSTSTREDGIPSITEKTQGEESSHLQPQAQNLNSTTYQAPWKRDWRQGHATPVQTYPRGNFNKLNADSSAYDSLPTTTTPSAGTTRGKMPKNFAQPLTCFYWHAYGWCTKSDDQCLYAHYNTGVIASAPVSLGGAPGSFAGRNAIHEVNVHATKERDLKNWEASLESREMVLNGKLATQWAGSQRVHKTLESGKTAAINTHRRLANARAEVSSAPDQVDSQAVKTATAAIDAAIDAVCGMRDELAKLEQQVYESVRKA